MLAQGPGHETISGGVGGKFLFPKRTIVDWQVGMFGTSMPETTIHKDNDTLAGKGEIRFPKMALAATPAGDAMHPEKFGKRKFSVLVAMSPNA